MSVASAGRPTRERERSRELLAGDLAVPQPQARSRYRSYVAQAVDRRPRPAFSKAVGLPSVVEWRAFRSQRENPRAQ